MATDSSSGTLPSSSRLTIVSSSSIARSNGSFAISVLLSCTIVRLSVARIAPYAIRATKLSPHQRIDMRGHRIAERLEIVAAFEQRDDAAAGVAISNLHDLLRRPGKIRFLEIDAGQRVAVVGVKAGRDDDELGREFGKPRQDAAVEGVAEFLRPVARPQRRIDDG